MKRLQTYFKLAFSSALLVMASCETNELDLTEDPNFLTPAQASSDFFLNSIQEDFAKLALCQAYDKCTLAET